VVWDISYPFGYLSRNAALAAVISCLMDRNRLQRVRVVGNLVDFCERGSVSPGR